MATRLKEIGIRKVIGGQKKEIITQFLTENFLMCSLALLVGVIISYLFMLPGFNALFPTNILFEFSSGNIMFLFFAGLLFFIGLISGAYPAFYIASFQPIEILRGKEKFGQKKLIQPGVTDVSIYVCLHHHRGAHSCLWTTAFTLKIKIGAISTIT